MGQPEIVQPIGFRRSCLFFNPLPDVSAMMNRKTHLGRLRHVVLQPFPRQLRSGLRSVDIRKRGALDWFGDRSFRQEPAD